MTREQLIDTVTDRLAGRPVDRALVAELVNVTVELLEDEYGPIAEPADT